MRTFDCSVRLWDVQIGKELARFTGHTAPVCWVAISPDGRLGLSVGEDRTVRLWDLTPGGCAARRQRPPALSAGAVLRPAIGRDDKQHYCWQDKEIPKTVFEIAVTADALTEEEQRHRAK